MGMGLKSITGAARYLLSDLRNAPFSPKKIFQLLTNLDALKEAFLFKTKAGFWGDNYSVLMLGEQRSIASRGIALARGQVPRLNWHLTRDEQTAYQQSFDRFMTEFSSEIIESNVIPPSQWEYRTAAHHSGCARTFLPQTESMDLKFFSVEGLPNTFVCDASLLRAGGIANSGLTLVACSHRFAELAIAEL
jgi:choline dehydrogenase-like flavoprotein